MRKVIYQHWIPFQLNDPAKSRTTDNTKEGTNCLSEPKSGYFHEWGTDVHDCERPVSFTVAIVEDAITGIAHMVIPNNMRFVQPPENVDKCSWRKDERTADGIK